MPLCYRNHYPNGHPCKWNIKLLWNIILTKYYYSDKINISNEKCYKHSVYQSVTDYKYKFFEGYSRKETGVLKEEKSTANTGLQY